MGKRNTTRAKRAAATPRGRSPQPERSGRNEERGTRNEKRGKRLHSFLIPRSSFLLGRPLALGIALLLLAGGLLAWRIHRRERAGVIAAGSSAGADTREAALLQAVAAHPDQNRPHRDLADYELAHRRPFEALWELAMARERGAVDVPLTLHVAQALQQAGLPEAAIRVLSAAREDFRGQPALDRELAQIDLAVADPQAAAQVIRSDPALAAGPDGLLLLARSHLALDDLPAARADWKRAAAAQRSASPAMELALGRLALALGDLPAARKELAAAAQGNPGGEETQYEAGLAFAAGGPAADTAAAIDHFKQATIDDPHRARAGVELGRLLYERSGQWESAAKVYRQALKMDARCLAAEAGLARVQAAQKQTGEVVYHQARVRELEDRPDEALPLYRRWGQRQPERWDSVLRAAECWMDMGRYLDAVREVQRGLQRYPDNPELFSHLAQLYLRTDSRPEAARLCDRWAAVDRSSGRPEWVRGQLAEKALRPEEAIRWYQAAVRKNPGFGTFHASLGAALASQPTPDRLAQARAEFERAAALDPGMAPFHAQLALVLQQMGDLEGARREYLRALDCDSDRLDAYAGLMTVARRLRQPGAASFFASLEQESRDRQRSEAAARLELSTQPRDARAHLTLARSLLQRGDLAAAKNQLEIAADQPDGAAARPLLRRVERLKSVL